LKRTLEIDRIHAGEGSVTTYRRMTDNMPDSQARSALQQSRKLLFRGAAKIAQIGG
jgi:hypothetical protein